MRNAWWVLVALLLVTALPNASSAQEAEEEAPPVLRMSWFMCDFSGDAGDAIQNEIENEVIPVWKAIKSEDMGIMDYGYVFHWWADEWNLGIWTIGESIPAIIEAEVEAGDRLEEMYGDGPSAFAAACPHHRDGFYTMGPSTMDESY